MKAQLINHFEINKLSAASQHGFRRGPTNTTTIIQLITAISDYFDAKESVTLILVDKTKDLTVSPITYFLTSFKSMVLRKTYWKSSDHTCQIGRSKYLRSGANCKPLTVIHGVPQWCVMVLAPFLLGNNKSPWPLVIHNSICRWHYSLGGFPIFPFPLFMEAYCGFCDQGVKNERGDDFLFLTYHVYGWDEKRLPGMAY